MEKIVLGLLVVLGVFTFAVGIGALLALPLMWLVNYLFAPSLLISVFGVSKIGFLQAWVLSILSSWLIKGTHSK